MTVPALETSEEGSATGDLALPAVLVDDYAVGRPVFAGGHASPNRAVRAGGVAVLIVEGAAADGPPNKGRPLRGRA